MRSPRLRENATEVNARARSNANVFDHTHAGARASSRRERKKDEQRTRNKQLEKLKWITWLTMCAWITRFWIWFDRWWFGAQACIRRVGRLRVLEISLRVADWSLWVISFVVAVVALATAATDRGRLCARARPEYRSIFGIIWDSDTYFCCDVKIHNKINWSEWQIAYTLIVKFDWARNAFVRMTNRFLSSIGRFCTSFFFFFLLVEDTNDVPNFWLIGCVQLFAFDDFFKFHRKPRKKKTLSNCYYYHLPIGRYIRHIMTVNGIFSLRIFVASKICPFSICCHWYRMSSI